MLDVPSLGVRIEFRRTTADTNGELLEIDVVGTPKGFIATPHVHPGQSERHEVIEGAMEMRRGGITHVLGPGDVIETPPGTRHRHAAASEMPGRFRVEFRPALRTEQWLERIASLDADGQIVLGWPRTVAGARLIDDFAGEAYGAFPPPRAQQAFARTVLKLAGAHSRR